MSEWRKITIGDLGKIVTGKTPSTKNENFWNGDIPFVTPSDLQKSKHVFFTERTVSQEGLTAVRGQVLPSGAICVSCIGNLGYTAMTTQTSVSNQQINSIIPGADFDKNFVYYLMKSLWDEFKNLEGQSTTLSILNKTLFSKMEVIVPDLSTQQKIAEVLSSLDDKIELNAQINHNLEEQAKAIFKSWFVDFEPFGGVAPDNWQKGKLKNILSLQKRPIKAGISKDLPYLPIDSIPMRTFAITDVRPNSEAQSSLLLFDKDDILIGAMRVYFHRVIIAPFDGITRTTCFVLKPNDPAYLSFALLTCDLDSSVDFAQKTSKGSTMPYAVWDGGMGEIDILIPPLSIAMEFNSIVLPMLRKIQDSYREVYSLQKLRDALLPKLMSGEIDVSEVEI